MKTIKRFIGLTLGILSAYMIFNGYTIFQNTSGVVQGSEFGMLITLANQMEPDHDLACPIRALVFAARFTTCIFRNLC